MLPEGTLTVLCEIGGFRRITNRSDYQKVRENFSMDKLRSLAEDLESGFLVSASCGKDSKIEISFRVQTASCAANQTIQGGRKPQNNRKLTISLMKIEKLKTENVLNLSSFLLKDCINCTEM